MLRREVDGEVVAFEAQGRQARRREQAVHVRVARQGRAVIVGDEHVHRGLREGELEQLQGGREQEQVAQPRVVAHGEHAAHGPRVHGRVVAARRGQELEHGGAQERLAAGLDVLEPHEDDSITLYNQSHVHGLPAHGRSRLDAHLGAARRLQRDVRGHGRGLPRGGQTRRQGAQQGARGARRRPGVLRGRRPGLHRDQHGAAPGQTRAADAQVLRLLPVHPRRAPGDRRVPSRHRRGRGPVPRAGLRRARDLARGQVLAQLRAPGPQPGHGRLAVGADGLRRRDARASCSSPAAASRAASWWNGARPSPARKRPRS